MIEDDFIWAENALSDYLYWQQKIKNTEADQHSHSMDVSRNLEGLANQNRLKHNCVRLNV